ncbi:uncharacterized protein LOC141534513 [Cotesia typhae]|uniref:uncharacterized protein LOC141534513 n=1 Tax=Cotesia typhae TaxID=2053667 RepID=UPI003D69768F
MKTVVSLLLITYAATISAREHPELCGGLHTGVNPCRECDRANIALFGADSQYKPPSYGFSSFNNGASGNKQTVLTPSPASGYGQVTYSERGCGGIGPIIQETSQQILSNIGTGGVLSVDSNANAVQTFQPVNDLCTHRKGLLKNNFLHKQRKLIVRPARPSRIPCKVDKPNSLTFGSGSGEYNSNTFQNKKITTTLNNFMNKATQKKIFNGNSIKEMNKFPVFNGGNAALGNIINKIGSNTLISSGSVSNALRPGSNIFSIHNLSTVATNTNINANINSGSHSVFSGLTTVLSDGKSNNKENTVSTGLRAELLIPVTHTNNNLNGQINNGQLNNFQSTNNQLIIGGQSSNDQFTNAQSTNNEFFNVQSTTGLVNSQFNNGPSQDSHSKPSAIVNFIDPSSGNIRAMTREEFCDDKKLSYEEQEKMYKGEKQTTTVDAVSWQLYLNKLMTSLIKPLTLGPTKKIPEVGLTYDYKQPPVNEYKKPEREIPEEIIQFHDSRPIEFKNPAPNVNPQILMDQLTSSFKECEPCNNKFIQQSGSQQIAVSDRVIPDDVPCGTIGTALPDYRPGTIEESQVNSESSEGNYGVQTCTCL